MPSRQYSKKIRFLLVQIETHLGNKIHYEQTSLVHICPYHPEDLRYESFGEGANDIQDRLGNMVLLSKDTLSRADFATKKIAYQSSGFELANQVAQYEDWNIATLNNYQQWLASQAVQTWRVD